MLTVYPFANKCWTFVTESLAGRELQRHRVGTRIGCWRLLHSQRELHGVWQVVWVYICFAILPYGCVSVCSPYKHMWSMCVVFSSVFYVWLYDHKNIIHCRQRWYGDAVDTLINLSEIIERLRCPKKVYLTCLIRRVEGRVVFALKNTVWSYV